MNIKYIFFLLFVFGEIAILESAPKKRSHNDQDAAAAIEQPLTKIAALESEIYADSPQERCVASNDARPFVCGYIDDFGRCLYATNNKSNLTRHQREGSHTHLRTKNKNAWLREQEFLQQQNMSKEKSLEGRRAHKRQLLDALYQ